MTEDWRPIESAPKDGTPILVYSPERCSCCESDSTGMALVRWKNGCWYMGKLQKGGYVVMKHRPTLWHGVRSPAALSKEIDE